MAVILGKGLCSSEEGIKLKGMRRADSFCRMCVTAAQRALEDAAFEPEQDSDCLGIIVSTQFGPHSTTFRFLDDIIDYKDSEVSPTKFSHSVHNAAASYVAAAVGSRGPTTTVTSFEEPYKAALQLAELWLDEKRAGHILVGYVEESSAPFEFIRSLTGLPSYSDEVLRAGAFFMLLSPAKTGGEPVNYEHFCLSPLKQI